MIGPSENGFPGPAAAVEGPTGLAEDRANFTVLLTAYIVTDEVSNIYGSKVYDLE